MGLACGLVGACASTVAFAATPNDPLFAAGDQYYLTQVHAPGAWDITKGSSSVVVGVVDDGLNPSTADLATKLAPESLDFSGVGDDDVSQDPGISAHGYRTAALVGAATNNGIGMAGAGWNVRVAELKVRDDAPGGRFDRQDPTDIAQAFEYAGKQGIRVVSASFGLRGSATADEKAAVRKAILEAPNTLFVVSAGNGDVTGSNVDLFSTGTRYPCRIKANANDTGAQPDNLICVGGTAKGGGLWGRSNYGANTVGLLAPAESIKTLLDTDSGTSYSTPLVAATAALYLSCYPSATTAQIRDAIFDTVDPVPSAAGKTITGGELDMAAALARGPKQEAGCVPAGGTPTATPTPGPGATPTPTPTPKPEGGSKTRKVSVTLPKKGGLRTALRRGVRIKLKSKVRVRTTVRLRLRKSVARRHHVARTIATDTRTCKAGTTAFRVRLSRKVQRRLRRLHTLRVAVRVSLRSTKKSVRVRPASRSGTLKLVRH